MSGKDFQTVTVVEFIFNPHISFYPMCINDEMILLAFLFYSIESLCGCHKNIIIYNYLKSSLGPSG